MITTTTPPFSPAKRTPAKRLKASVPRLPVTLPWHTPLPSGTNKRLGILLLNLGGPTSPESVKPFLYNLFADNDIVQLPFPQWLQNLFAWRVSNKREHEAQENYGKLGGKSPILELTQAQAYAMMDRLHPLLNEQGWEHVECVIGMRYWHPRCDEALRQLQEARCTHLMILPLYPQYCLGTIGSSMRELNGLMQRNDFAPWVKTLRVANSCSFYSHPAYIKSVVATIQKTLHESTFTCPKHEVLILFSAHGIPQKYAVKNNDPYPKQVKRTMANVMQALEEANGFRNPDDVCWQSRVGPMEWLRPYTEDKIDELIEQQRDNIIMVPISFVSDHIETLFEMDMLYVPQAIEGGLTHTYRAESLNTHPLFIECLAIIVLQTLATPDVCKIDFTAPPPPLEKRGVCAMQTQITLPNTSND
ncbi:MAG: ferrochelatase [Vampirovibrionales bacterium]